MARYRLTLSYRGGAYAGWQRQANALAVQQVIEEALADLVGTEVRIVAAGRTDAGVHARGQVAHLHLARPFACRGLVHGTNHRLPEDVRVLAAEAVDESFHALRDARGKLYSYRLVRAFVVSPLDAPFAVAIDPSTDLSALARATALLPGRHDFTAFTYHDATYRDPRRRIFSAAWSRQGDELVFRIVGEGFLRGMVRTLVGTLLEVGRGKRSLDNLAGLLAGSSVRADAGPTAPAHGLTLERVLYPPPWGAAADAAMLRDAPGCGTFSAER